MTIKDDIAARSQGALEYLYAMANERILPEHPLRDAALHYSKSGGKGFRPAMLLLSCGAVGGNEQTAVPVAAAIEALHVSSLIHDDFMDNDETRRGAVSVWKKWDPTIAVLSGDVLIGFAMELIYQLTNVSQEVHLEIHRGLAEKYRKLCQGQMLDIEFTTRDPFTISVEEVKEMQYLKTGILFEFCCVSGAQIGLNALKHEFIDIIRVYAKNAGTAFQIQDDILGLIGDEQKLGKPIGSDIREGKRTLIAIHALSKANEKQKQRILRGFGNHDASPDDYAGTLEVFKELGAIDYAKNLAVELATKAKEVLKGLPDTEQRTILTEFANYMISRIE